MVMTLGVLISIIIIVGLLFLELSPEFGGTATKAQQSEYVKSDNYKDGKFINIGNVKPEMSSGDMLKAIGGMFKTIPNATPKIPISNGTIDSTNIADYNSPTRFVWFGHSTFLAQINGKNILIDPMLGQVPAPHPWLGTKRFNNELPITSEKLPPIDAVLISHDHYDHLDYNTIIKIKEKVNHFYTPLGVGNHLLKWGVPKDKITELDWWEDTKFDNLTFTSTPSQHFSGRGLTDRDKTLWCSWVIQSPTENIFFSGDSGYASHFKAIGKKFGHFDFAMIECGQYNKLWSEVHMFPEETAQAGIDLNAKKIMPIHWASFKLAQHSWTDPIERVAKKANELKIELITPMIGKPFGISDHQGENSKWWKNF
ncbi:MBL fold metallo-hydrolase [Puteibacter caeruleilacunae]|nr:MBL fold metallo-hydrolase [Puteibacter caeruleilacunae]